MAFSVLCDWTEHSDRLIGVDALFFDEADAVCLVGSERRERGPARAAEGIMRAAGRRPIWMREQAGLILPRIVACLVNEATFALEEGVASAETIDRAMRLGARYPRGPIAWGHALGWRRVGAVLDHLFSELHDPRYRMSMTLRRWAREGGPNPAGA